MASDAFVRVVQGPLGSGKSSACVLELGQRACLQAPQTDGVRRTRFAVVRNTYGQLRDTTRKTFEQWFPPHIGRWSEQEFTFTMRARLADTSTQVESEIMFRALDRPEDVTKLLSLELTGAYINELREVPKEILDGLTGRVGRFPARKEGGCTWFGVWGDTNPWHTGHWGYKLFRSPPAVQIDGKPVEFKLYTQPGGRTKEAENVENLPPGYYERLCIGKDAEWIRVYVDGLNGSSDVGSIFGQCLDAVEQRGGIASFDIETAEVHACLDLGLADATALWWWIPNHLGGVDVLDWYEQAGKPLSHYFDEIDKREQDGWRHSKLWLPHDATHETLGAQSSILSQFIERYGMGRVAIGPKLSKQSGIESGRWLLERPGTRFHERCRDGIDRLREYRFQWDEANRCYSRHPLHDFASHTGDAWRYVGGVARVAMALADRPPQKRTAPPIMVKGNRLNVSLEDLWKERTARSRGGRI